MTTAGEIRAVLKTEGWTLRNKIAAACAAYTDATGLVVKGLDVWNNTARDASGIVIARVYDVIADVATDG